MSKRNDADDLEAAFSLYRLYNYIFLSAPAVSPQVSSPFPEPIRVPHPLPHHPHCDCRGATAPTPTPAPHVHVSALQQWQRIRQRGAPTTRATLAKWRTAVAKG